LIDPWLKKVEITEAPHNRRFHGKMKCISLWPNYIGEKGRTLGKTYGIKARCYWVHPWGTHWELKEHIGNLKGTCWEQMKKKQSLPPPNLKGKKSRHFDCMHEIFIWKTVGHYFWPGLIPPL